MPDQATCLHVRFREESRQNFWVNSILGTDDSGREHMQLLQMVCKQRAERGFSSHQ